MNLSERITDMERELHASGKTADHLCRHAGIARSTWTRWKSGAVAPNTRTLERVEEALRAVTAPPPSGVAAE